MGEEGGKVVVVLGTEDESVGELEGRADGLVHLNLGSLNEVVGGEDICTRQGPSSQSGGKARIG